MKKSIIATVAVIAVILLAAVAVSETGLLSSRNDQDNNARIPAAITIGTTAQISSALLYIADDRSFFADDGLNVTIRYYDSGRTAVDHVLDHDVDLAAATEYVLVGRVFEGKNLQSIGTIGKSENTYLISRTDKGIRSVSDLKGKKIGFNLRTMSEFHLSRFLTLHGMSMREVVPVNLNASQTVTALESGDVDAVMTWQPYVDEIQRRMGNDIIMWPAQNGQPYYWSVICTDDWLSGHPAEATKFLNALARAEKYSMKYPAQAKTIVHKRLNLDDSYLETVWPENQLVLLLDQSLILAMEDEARWMIANNMTNATTIPDFRKFISTQSLRNVEPGAATIV
ncbi:MAG TPA: ABC transporter substrate-binding protein [Methanoregula sp.]|nr:ABC transporter substrate-binding protein [Methanoregula sp.]